MRKYRETLQQHFRLANDDVILAGKIHTNTQFYRYNKNNGYKYTLYDR